MELYVAYSKLCKGKLFNRKRKPHTMFEKRHKINKFANYQNIIVKNSPAFDRHAFVSSQDRRSMDFDVIRTPLLIALQVVRTSFGFHLRECMGSSFPPWSFQSSKSFQSPMLFQSSWRPQTSKSSECPTHSIHPSIQVILVISFFLFILIILVIPVIPGVWIVSVL